MFCGFVIAGESVEIAATDSSGVAIKGYDTVAYFTERKAIKGNPEFAYTWNDARWQFANANHQEQFAGDPERYAPQFGGFCANGLTMNKVVPADPEQWTIVDDKLYLKYSSSARENWRENKVSKIGQANDNWTNYLKGATP